MQNSATRPWKLRCEQTAASDVAMLEAETGLSTVTLSLCLSRGLKTAESIKSFLSPKLEELKDPYSILAMDKAVNRIVEARARAERVRVFADYDVDGTTGAALLAWVFRDCKITFDVRQPDRFKDGYGLNVGAVEQAKCDGVSVLVSVDCGITSFEAANKARELGIDLIVVDHHQIDSGRGLPIALAVINPQRLECESGLKQLCGCALAFYLARALRSRGKRDGWWAPGMEPNLKQHLDLVVMATSADMVPLTGDNHILVRHGMECLRHSRKPGVRALLAGAGIGAKSLSPSHLGFVLGPRINASGRMANADMAYELLITTDWARAIYLANQLEVLNTERVKVQNDIWNDVKLRVEEGLKAGLFANGIVVADKSWHEGVVGIVASRVVETFHKPAVVIALRDSEGIGKGSVRSSGGKNVLSAIQICARDLLGFGGHKHAAGITIGVDNVDGFARAFDRAIGDIKADSDADTLWCDGVCQLNDFDVKTLQEIENMGPFGPGNPEPVFSFRASVLDHRVLKGRHLKFNLISRPAKTKTLEAIWFNAADKPEAAVWLKKDVVTALEAEWAAVPELNRYNGRVTPTLRVRDWRHPGGC